MRAATRKERLCAITAILTQKPNEIYPLSHFAELFGAAKSTLSEDVSIIKSAFEEHGLGEIEVILGASGGVRYIPGLSRENKQRIVEEVCDKLADPGRILPGGFIYTADLLMSPYYVDNLAQILWGYFSKTNPDFIITAEAKGIPLAMGVARLFSRPLVVARKESKLTEGSVVTINYVSGSSKRLKAMSLSKRAVHEGQRTLIIDDFIAGGGTVAALADMMKEFCITVVGCGAAIAMKQPEHKRIDHYRSILTLESIDEEARTIRVYPSEI